MIIWNIPYNRSELTYYFLGLVFIAHKLGLEYRIFPNNSNENEFPIHSTFDAFAFPYLHQSENFNRFLRYRGLIFTSNLLDQDVIEECKIKKVKKCFIMTYSMWNNSEKRELFTKHNIEYDFTICTSTTLYEILQNYKLDSKVVLLPYLPPYLPSLHNPEVHNPEIIGIFMGYTQQKSEVHQLLKFSDQIYNKLNKAIILYFPNPIAKNIETLVNKSTWGREDKIDAIYNQSFDYAQYNLTFCDVMIYPFPYIQTELPIAALLAGGIPVVMPNLPLCSDFCKNNYNVLLAPLKTTKLDHELINLTSKLIYDNTIYNNLKSNLSPDKQDKTWYSPALLEWKDFYINQLEYAIF
ncbi:MAG: hypothetical protein QXH92_03915 [Candidatus Aenigmatarchaeota archaeon]